MISYKGHNGHTRNYLKAITFDHPEWIPCRVGLMPATWIKYREELERLVLDHPRIFPGYARGSRDFDRIDDPLYELGRHTDCWGTVWDNIERGLDSHPVEFPLEDWTAWDSYVRPDPLMDDMWGPRDWEQAERSLDTARRQGNIAIGAGLPHGFMYMRLFYLRRFENLMIDMATEDQRLWQVIQMVETYNSVVIGRLLSLGAELILFGDDLGLQRSLPMSPAMWRKYIKPSYERMLRPCREADVPVYLHTDGHVLDVVADLIECLNDPKESIARSALRTIETITEKKMGKSKFLPSNVRLRQRLMIRWDQWWKEQNSR